MAAAQINTTRPGVARLNAIDRYSKQSTERMELGERVSSLSIFVVFLSHVDVYVVIFLPFCIFSFVLKQLLLGNTES